MDDSAAPSVGEEGKEWYSLTAPRVLEALHATSTGLSTSEATERLGVYGENALPAQKPESFVRMFARQFASPLIYLLLGASLIIFALGEYVDAVVIFLVLFFNAVIGVVQEGRAQRTLEALRSFTATLVDVVRDGGEHIVHDSQLVPGDIVMLDEGDRVPADARLLDAEMLKVDEAALTGESVPAEKDAETLPAGARPPSEQRCMVFKGTHVVTGRGRAVVVATGTHTYIGGIARAIVDIKSDIPLAAGIRQLSRIIIGLVAIFSLFLFVLGISEGYTTFEMFLIVVSVVVSVIPEGLPIVMTLVLASGVWRMSKRHALVKKLQAVEALGQAQVIAVDKTGTLTKNEMVVTRIYAGERLFDVSGAGYAPEGGVSEGGVAIEAANHPELLRAGKLAALCAAARVVYDDETKEYRISGDPTEAAMLVAAQKLGFHREMIAHEEPISAELPFDYRLKYHAVETIRADGRAVAVVGAPEAILEMCTHIAAERGNVQFSDAARTRVAEVQRALAERGLRVVAVAEGAGGRPLNELSGLTFVGFMAMSDPLRPEVREAIAGAREAGMRVVMITGDHAITARAIATDAGIYLPGDVILTGPELETLTKEDLMAKVEDVSVFARVTPEHKMRIIEAYKARGEIIAMTGDGVNDAPSLVAADLGVAMGKIGTEVAKEASDIVLLNDDFGSIVGAIEEGRSIYKTIKKVILYLFSTSLGEALVIGGALVLLLPLPLLATQIIWLNFVTDGFLTVALAMEPKEKGLLHGAFRRSMRRLVDGLMVRRMITMALPMAVGTLVLFAYYAASDMEKALTMSLTTLAIFQWFNAWNCRSDRESVFTQSPLSNMWLVGATGLVVVLQMAAVYVPFMQHVLHTVPLAPLDWALAVAVALSIVGAEEVRKFFYRFMYPLRTSGTLAP
jgi:Ca2+-transporting ATPase